jgi:hypothetical protein
MINVKQRGMDRPPTHVPRKAIGRNYPDRIAPTCHSESFHPSTTFKDHLWISPPHVQYSGFPPTWQYMACTVVLASLQRPRVSHPLSRPTRSKPTLQQSRSNCYIYQYRRYSGAALPLSYAIMTASGACTTWYMCRASLSLSLPLSLQRETGCTARPTLMMVVLRLEIPAVHTSFRKNHWQTSNKGGTS